MAEIGVRGALPILTTSLVVMTIAVACGSDGESAPSPPAGTSTSSGGSSTSGSSSGGVLGDGDAATSDGSSGSTTCAGEPCATNDPCAPNGVIDCSSGAPVCKKAAPFAADGTTCATGSCTTGACRPDMTVSSDLDLSADAVTNGRTCAEGIAYAVTALTTTTAVVSETIGAGCLAEGDEVLLINLQGTSTSTANVGVYETLHVKDASGTTVTFDAPKTKAFGDAAGSDANVGTDPTQQKVALVRVPTFGKLTIAAGKKVTAAAWNGAKGGVVALRANTLTIDGTIDAREIGYRGGRWSRDDDDCSDSVQTEAGESIGGPGGATASANGGGSGGIGALTATSFNGDDPLTGSAGHASAGQAGANFQGRTASEPGAAYGVADGTKLTMGSGAGGNLTCENGFAGPALVDVGPRAGGIIALFGGNITVSATGVIDAGPPGGSRSVPSAGYVLLRGDVIDFSAGAVQAKAVAGSSVGGTYTNVGSEGRIAVLFATSVAGTSDPPAFTQKTP